MPHSANDHPPAHWLKTKVATWFWSLTPTCREVTRLTSEGRDRDLPLGVRMRLGLHRSFCQWCARYAEQLDLVGEAAHGLPEHAEHLDGGELSRDAKARMKRVLKRRMGGEL